VHHCFTVEMTEDGLEFSRANQDVFYISSLLVAFQYYLHRSYRTLVIESRGALEYRIEPAQRICISGKSHLSSPKETIVFIFSRCPLIFGGLSLKYVASVNENFVF